MFLLLSFLVCEFGGFENVLRDAGICAMSTEVMITRVCTHYQAWPSTSMRYAQYNCAGARTIISRYIYTTHACAWVLRRI